MSTVVEQDKQPTLGKEYATPSERRFAYRSQLDGNEALSAQVSGESGDATGQVHDVSLKGISVVIDVAQDPVFFVGEHVTVSLDFEGKKSAQVEAVVRGRTELDGSRRFGFSFANPAALRAKLPAGLLRLFNERKTFRVEPQEPLPVRLQVPGTSLPTPGHLRDISVEGLRVVLAGEDEKELRRVVDVSVEFTLPGQDQAMIFAASIRNRSRLDTENAVSLGLRFDPDRSSDFSAQQRIVIEYVMRRQRELLQSRVGT